MWSFIQNEILGMQWLNRLLGSLVETVGLDPTSRIGGSIQFFFYDVIKIMVLLTCLIFVISYIQSYFPPERTKKILGRFHGIGANCVAALLGTVTPFCSCSSIPLFIGFTSAGLPLGVTFSFLISSPMVDLGSLVLLMSIFGWKVAVVYVVLGLVIAITNPFLGAMYSFFFSNVVGKQISKAIFTTAILCGILWLMDYFHLVVILITPAALLTYIPLALAMLVLWFLIGHLL